MLPQPLPLTGGKDAAKSAAAHAAACMSSFHTLSTVPIRLASLRARTAGRAQTSWTIYVGECEINGAIEEPGRSDLTKQTKNTETTQRKACLWYEAKCTPVITV